MALTLPPGLGRGVTGPEDWEPCLTLQGFHQTRAQSQRLSQAPVVLASSEQSQHRWAIYPQEEKSNTILLGLALWDMMGSFGGLCLSQLRLCNKHRRQGGLNNRRLFPTVLEAGVQDPGRSMKGGKWGRPSRVHSRLSWEPDGPGQHRSP